MEAFDPISFLERNGLRATRPRVGIVRLLFADGIDRHVSAEWVAENLKTSGQHVALATVYITLHSFAEAGVLRLVGSAATGVNLFDTNTTPHHHFYNETTGELTDIPADTMDLLNAPELPAGTNLVGYDVIFRVR